MAYQIKAFNSIEDKDKIFALWREKSAKNFERRFEYMYGASACCQIKTSLLIDEKSKKAVGCVSLFTHTISLNSHNLKLGVNCDMFVKKEHRMLGPAVILLKSLLSDARSEGYHALLAMPNAMSASVFKRAGYTRIGELRRWVKIIDFEDKLTKVIKNRLALKFFSKVFNFFSELFSLETGWRILYFFIKGWFLAKEIDFKEINLDEHLKKAGVLIKPPEYIEWRYYGMDNNNSKAFALTRNGLVVGLISYYVLDQNLILQDILLPKSAWKTKIMLAAFICKARLAKIKSISVLFLGRGAMAGIFKSFGFLRRESRSLCLHVLDQKFDDNFTDRHKLDLFEGDLDL